MKYKKKMNILHAIVMNLGIYYEFFYQKLFRLGLFLCYHLMIFYDRKNNGVFDVENPMTTRFK